MSKESRKFQVPDELANVYDFANSLDLRKFAHHGVRHEQDDELRSPAALAEWMRQRSLIERGAVASRNQFDQALRLRSAVRDYLKCDSSERQRNQSVIEAVNGAMKPFPLRVAAVSRGGVRL